MLALVVLALNVAGIIVLWQISRSRTFQFFGEIIPRVNTSEKVVALTFDDGPTVTGTDQVLSILAEQNVKATFFVITWDVEPESYPEIDASADKIAEHVLSNTRPGSIIILHVMYPNRRESMKAVPKIVEGLRAQGYSFKTMSELLQGG